MTLNRDYFEGKWQQTRGLIRQHWAELTDDDLNQLQGRYDQFVGLLVPVHDYTQKMALGDVFVVSYRVSQRRGRDTSATKGSSPTNC